MSVVNTDAAEKFFSPSEARLFSVPKGARRRLEERNEAAKYQK
jgi:hypothetical protein